MSPHGKRRLEFQFPFQLTSLKNLRNEKWRDIPGFEGYYKISNYGRVKSLSRTMQMNTPNGGEYVSKEKIRRCKLEVRLNKTVNDNLYTVMISLYYDGNHYNFSVPRLVYYVFKERFDIDDRRMLISYRDRDARNTHVSNLVKKNISELKLNSYKEGRSVSHLKKLSKPVTQFDTKGNPVATYVSMYEAGKKNGLSEKNIAEVASGKGHMYGGFFWKHGKHSRNLNLRRIQRNQKRDAIHWSLMKRLGIKIEPRKPVPHCLNLSTEAVKGERWKDAPGYEGLYKVSNRGRVKALQKITEGKQQKWMPEQIQKIQVDFRRKGRKKIPGSTFACMAKQGKKSQVSIPRIVYYLFVKKFNLNNPSWRIYYKDNNPLNVTPENLMLKQGVYSILKKNSSSVN